MTKNEKKLFEAVPANEFNTYWVPCTWFIFRWRLWAVEIPSKLPPHLMFIHVFNTGSFRVQEAAKKGKLLNQYALESIMRVCPLLKAFQLRHVIPGPVLLLSQIFSWFSELGKIDYPDDKSDYPDDLLNARNFANSERGAAFFGVTIGSPSRWCTHRFPYQDKIILMLFSLVGLGR